MRFRTLERTSTSCGHAQSLHAVYTSGAPHDTAGCVLLFTINENSPPRRDSNANSMPSERDGDVAIVRDDHCQDATIRCMCVKCNSVLLLFIQATRGTVSSVWQCIHLHLAGSHAHIRSNIHCIRRTIFTYIPWQVTRRSEAFIPVGAVGSPFLWDASCKLEMLPHALHTADLLSHRISHSTRPHASHAPSSDMSGHPQISVV